MADLVSSFRSVLRLALGVSLLFAAGCAHIPCPAAGRYSARAFQRAVESSTRRVYPSVVVVAVERVPSGATEMGLGAGELQMSWQTFTGVVLTPDGYILAPQRYKADYPGRIEVRIGPDVYPARPVRSSESLGMTVLKIRPREPLVPIDRRRTADLAPGEWAVIVIPSELPDAEERFVFPSICRGEWPGRFRRFVVTGLPTMARGAPVLNLRGELVGWLDERGILSARDTREELDRLLPSGLNQGGLEMERSRGWLGVVVEPVNRDLARMRSWPTSALWVVHVAKGSPAATVGLQKGDVIVAVNGQPLRFSGPRVSEFFFQTLGQEPGRRFHLKVLRDGRSVELSGTLARRPVPETFQAEDLGLTVQTVADYDVVQRNLFVGHGVLVTAVAKGGPAATGSSFGRGLIQTGDVIVELDGRPTPDVKAFRTALDDIRRRNADVVLVRCVRGRTTEFEALNLRIGKTGRQP